jgi:hypothetical protein
MNNRVRFEPIDIPVKELKQFENSYNKLRDILNEQYGYEIIPSIRKIYLVDDAGFPVDPKLKDKI